MLVELRRPSLAAQMATQSYSPSRQRQYVASLGNEATALQGALRAKGVQLRNPLLFARVWNGFAATVDVKDLPEIRALGLRAEPVRRFYGAAAGTATGTADGRGQGAGVKGLAASGAPSVALLDSGVDRTAPGLAGRVVPGYDAVGGDHDPRPAGARERHGTQVAEVLAQALGPRGGLILSVRVAGLQPDPATGGRIEVSTTDQLLAGLERAVDPNGDGDSSDAVPVALVAVNSPYAGFADSPEAVAAGGARALGTLVVAPAGNEGRGGGTLGTVGSPAAAPGVLAVGAVEGGGAPALPEVKLGLATSEGRALLRGTLLGGAGRALKAPVGALAGPSQANPRGRGRALGGSPLEYFEVNANPRAGGRVVVVPARGPGGAGAPSLSARAAAAADAGAVALVVAEPDRALPLPALPDGGAGIPVIGLRGDAAARALALTPHDGGVAFLSAPEARIGAKATVPAPSSSQGPSYALGPKPDLVAPGTATITARNGGELVTGTSVAAARVAAAAARVKQARPAARPDDLFAALVGTAKPLGPPLATGAGELSATRALDAAVLIEPATIALPREPSRAPFSTGRPVAVHNLGTAPATVTLSTRMPGVSASIAPTSLTVPAGSSAKVTLTVASTAGRPPGFLSGRITATGAATPVSAVLGMPIGAPPAPLLGPLSLLSPNGRTDGVRFTVGAVTLRNGTRSVEPLGNLRLELRTAAGTVVKELTPAGGAPDLLPGEYAYTLTKSARSGLAKGSYRFVARGSGPAGGAELERTSPSFTVR